MALNPDELIAQINAEAAEKTAAVAAAAKAQTQNAALTESALTKDEVVDHLNAIDTGLFRSPHPVLEHMMALIRHHFSTLHTMGQHLE